MLPQIVFTDIDGVWTDGGMYYDGHQAELKKFNTTDSGGVLLLRSLNIPTVIITGEDTEIVRRRAKKLSISDVHCGVTNKLAVAKVACMSYDCEISNTAFIGDDLNDIQLLRQVGWPACPKNAPKYIKREARYITEAQGGQGAFREFAEHILESCGALEEAVRKVLKNHEMLG